MKNYIFLLLCALLFTACDDEELSVSPKLKLQDAYFEYEYPNCTNESNPEQNCSQWIHFKKDNKADVLLGGGDIVFQATYSVSDSNIYLIYENEGLNEDADGFNIKDENTLIRFLYDEVWVRKEE